MRMVKLKMGDLLLSMYRSHTEKVEMRRRKGCANKDQKESADGEVGHDNVCFGGQSGVDCLKVAFVRLPILLLRGGIHFCRLVSRRASTEFLRHLRGSYISVAFVHGTGGACLEELID
jgi:hypothetical protein